MEAKGLTVIGFQHISQVLGEASLSRYSHYHSLRHVETEEHLHETEVGCCDGPH